jgi:hypothetical protein
MGYNAVQFVKSQPTFRKKISPPSLVSKNKPNKKPAGKQVATIGGFHACFMLGLIFDPEDGGDNFLRNVG